MRDPREVFGKVGIVAAGGGFRGACIPGALQALVRRKIITPDNLYLQGVSVSAFMMAKFSEAHVEEDFQPILDSMIERWNFIEQRGPEIIFDFPKNIIELLFGKKIRISQILNSNPHQPHYILENKRLFWLLDNFNENLSISSPIRLDFPVIDNETKKQIMLSNRDEAYQRDPKLMRQGIVGSASLRPIFPPVEVLPGVLAYDGGHINLRRAMEEGCDTVFVLFPYPEIYRKPRPGQGFFGRHSRLLEEFASCYSAALRKNDADQLEMMKLRNELIVAANHEGFLEKIRSRFSSLASDALESLQLLEQETKIPPKPLRTIPLYPELRETLELSNFDEGDITHARERFDEQTDKAIDRFLKDLS